MRNLNIYILAYIAIVVTIGFVWLFFKQKWSFFDLIKGSLTSVEQRLCGFDEHVYPIIITNDSGVVSSVNRATMDMFGFSESEFVKHNLKLIIPERFWAAHSAGMARMVGKEMDDKTYILQALRKNKSEIPIKLLLRKKKVKDDFFYIATIQDITEYVHKDKVCEAEITALALQVDILNHGEELGLTGSWIWDLRRKEGLSETQLITSVGYKKITGLFDFKEYDSSYLKKRVWSEDEDIVNQALEGAFKGQKYDITYRMVKDDDLKVIYIRSIVQPVTDDNGIVIFMYGSTRLLQTLNLKDAVAKPIT